MKYTEKSVTTGSAALVALAVVDTFASIPSFLPWQPSTWPPAPVRVDVGFIGNLRKIFAESVLGEIRNVIEDIKKSNGDLQHRGHVVAIALMCALDSISSYGYRGHNVTKFVGEHFPGEYKPYANDVYHLYRNSMIHSWNLFEAAILPGIENITKTKGTLCFGLLNFFGALESGVEDFLKKLATATHLQANTLNRYKALRKTARP
ncbi:hypothetical protein W02_40380 [Nitrospira sp. KM1]|uniref:hypothetical protein n=1 Tax=Nitrospira sp. KM1 TaxID=1936990 RepID=UPI0013A73A70|nr:hypothetical protein [Nitrospira sp. KM1]BCA56898.1 hypothetical protein W02_40380 [Nitrospira sp. KM1]